MRILSATHRPLEELVAKGGFRQDLYFRLRVVEIRMPVLREQRESIPELVEAFLARETQRTGLPKKIQREAMAKLVARDWPGNVRELENEILRLCALSGETITPDLVETPRSGSPILPRSGRPVARGETHGGSRVGVDPRDPGAHRRQQNRGGANLGNPAADLYSRLDALGLGEKSPPSGPAPPPGPRAGTAR